MTPSFVYAIGKVGYRFPNKSLEMELRQATGRISEQEIKGNIREEVIYKTLTDPNNRYIARQICYILNIERLETYILAPTDPLDTDRLAKAVRDAPDDDDVDVIIGRRGPIAPLLTCVMDS